MAASGAPGPKHTPFSLEHELLEAVVVLEGLAWHLSVARQQGNWAGADQLAVELHRNRMKVFVLHSLVDPGHGARLTNIARIHTQRLLPAPSPRPPPKHSASLAEGTTLSEEQTGV